MYVTDVLLKSKLFLADDTRLLEIPAKFRFLFNLLPLVLCKQARWRIHQAIALCYMQHRNHCALLVLDLTKLILGHIARTTSSAKCSLLRVYCLFLCWAQRVSPPKRLNSSRWRLGKQTRVGLRNDYCMGCVLAPPGEYDWTIRAWWQCGLMSN